MTQEKSLNQNSGLNIKKLKVKESCCSSDDSCCDSTEELRKNQVAKGVINIDGEDIKLLETDKNIVDITQRKKITLPAPCYLANKEKGCCSSCLIKVNGNQKYACTTFPEDGMTIEIATEELKKVRELRLKEYAQRVKSGNYSSCFLEN